MNRRPLDPQRNEHSPGCVPGSIWAGQRLTAVRADSLIPVRLICSVRHVLDAGAHGGGSVPHHEVTTAHPAAD
jgi:hypothetical protein